MDYKQFLKLPPIQKTMWETKENKLYKKFKFGDFSEAIQFINQVAELSTQVNHHPSILNNYNVVEIWLCTHDENNQITAKDHELANMINEIK
jgi:4a-hydroxytetrahydrobiopterin dehydratase